MANVGCHVRIVMYSCRNLKTAAAALEALPTVPPELPSNAPPKLVMRKINDPIYVSEAYVDLLRT